MAWSAGTRLGAFEVLAPLGAGGMGEVYRARDTRLGREVAIKLLRSDVASDPERLARFEREARTLAALNHPNIVTIHSVEEAAGVRFLAMELVDGPSLDRLVAPGGLSLARVLDVAIPLAGALAAAHERGVVHRDLKPSNVMLTADGRVKVLDFGLAKSRAADAAELASRASTVAGPISSEGLVLGTVPYMAPEQVRGEAADARTDLFAFGVLLYELATGRRPFAGATAADVMSSILRDAPPPVQAVRGYLPADIGRLVAHCLEKDPERRAQSAKDVRNQLELVRREIESGGVTARRGPADAGTEAASVAVLPFANRGPAGEDEYFADGITEDVIAQLCKVRTLKVISRASVMPYKQRPADPKEIAATLQVGHLLEGSVRRAGDRVRIVATLVDPASGRSLWAETYDRHLTDIFAIQSEVALQIAEALKAELAPDEQQRIRRAPTRNVEAYETYLRGRHSLLRYTVEEELRSIPLFERASRLDPGFALPHVGIAIAYTELGENGMMVRGQAAARALAAGARAVELDPELGDAHGALAYARLTFEFDWKAAEEGMKRALAYSPNNADMLDFYGRMCAGLGRYDEAITLHRRASELDPLAHRADLATSYLRAGRVEEAVAAARKGVAVDPDYPRSHATLGWALLRQGRTEEGLAELERAVATAPAETAWLAQLGQAYAELGRTGPAREILGRLTDPSRPVPTSPYHLAYLHVGLGEPDLAMDQLERAFELGSGALYGIRGSFLLAPLREQPRFKALLRRMKLE